MRKRVGHGFNDLTEEQEATMHERKTSGEPARLAPSGSVELALEQLGAVAIAF